MIYIDDSLVSAIMSLAGQNTNWINSIISLLTTSPDVFFNSITTGDVYGVVEVIHRVMLIIGYQILGIFFLLELSNKSLQFENFNYKILVKVLIKFVFAKMLLDNSMIILEGFFGISATITNIVNNAVSSTSDGVLIVLNEDSVKEVVKSLNLFTEMFMFIVIWIIQIFLFVIKIFVGFLVVGRILTLYIYTALAPIPLAMFVSDSFSITTKRFLQEFASKCLNSLTILVCILLYQQILMGIIFEPISNSISSILLNIGLFLASNVFLIVMIRKSQGMMDKMVGVN